MKDPYGTVGEGHVEFGEGGQLPACLPESGGSSTTHAVGVRATDTAKRPPASSEHFILSPHLMLSIYVLSVQIYSSCKVN